MSDYREQKRPVGMKRTAGEVRFIKDHGDDSNAWAWGQHPPSERRMDRGHKLNARCTKDLARVLKSSLVALGHTMSAYSTFAKIKSRDISPDGNLGGRGYIMEIKAMRRQFMNITEALSALSDTLYDEITADHWSDVQSKLVKDVLTEIEEIKEDPEEWAEQREDMEGVMKRVYDKEEEKKAKRTKKQTEDAPPERDILTSRSKTASLNRASQLAHRYMINRGY